MDKEKSLELVNEFEKVKNTLNQFDIEINNYQKATLSLEESSKSFIDLSNRIKEALDTTEKIKNEVFRISSEEVLNDFKENVKRVISEVDSFKEIVKLIQESNVKANEYIASSNTTLNAINQILSNQVNQLTITLNNVNQIVTELNVKVNKNKTLLIVLILLAIVSIVIGVLGIIL